MRAYCFWFVGLVAAFFSSLVDLVDGLDQIPFSVYEPGQVPGKKAPPAKVKVEPPPAFVPMCVSLFPPMPVMTLELAADFGQPPELPAVEEKNAPPAEPAVKQQIAPPDPPVEKPSAPAAPPAIDPIQDALDVFTDFRDLLRAGKFSDARLVIESFRAMVAGRPRITYLGDLLRQGALDPYFKDKDLTFRWERADWQTEAERWETTTKLEDVPRHKRLPSLLWALHNAAKNPGVKNGVLMPIPVDPESIEGLLIDGWKIKEQKGRQVILVKGGESKTRYRRKVAC